MFRDLGMKAIVCQWLHQFFIQMGIRAIGAKTVIRDNDTGDWETLAAQRQQVETDQISLDPFPAQLPEGIDHNMADCFGPMFQWLKGLVVGEGRQPVWLSSYQLLIHFQGTTGRMGVWYDRPNRRWLFAEDHAREHGFEFTRYSGWLMSASRLQRFVALPSLQSHSFHVGLFSGAGRGVFAFVCRHPFFRRLMGSFMQEVPSPSRQSLL